MGLTVSFHISKHSLVFTATVSTDRYNIIEDAAQERSTYQFLVEHAEFEVGEKIVRSDVDCLLVARKSHLVLPLALVRAAQSTENFAAERIHLQ